MKVENVSLIKWKTIISYLTKLQLYVLQYNQVYQEQIKHHPTTDRFTSYLTSLLSEVSECIEGLKYPALEELQKGDQGTDIQELSMEIQRIFEKAKIYLDAMHSVQPLEEVEHEIQLFLNGMILLAPYLIEVDG